MSDMDRFFERRNIPLTEIIRRGKGRFGLQEAAIRVAAKKVYERIAIHGEKIPERRISWLIWETAKSIEVRVRGDVQKRVHILRDEINHLRAECYGLFACNMVLLTYCIGREIGIW